MTEAEQIALDDARKLAHGYKVWLELAEKELSRVRDELASVRLFADQRQPLIDALAALMEAVDRGHDDAIAAAMDAAQKLLD